MSADDEDGCGVDPVTGRVLETPELREAGLRALRERMAESESKGEVSGYPRRDDKFLLAFLRARKYKIDKAHMVLNNFAKFWNAPKHREVLEGLSLNKARPFIALNMMRFLPTHRDKKGNVLSLLYGGNLDYSKFNSKDQLAASIYMFMHLLDDEEAQLQGLAYVETFEGFSLRAAMGINKAMSREEQKEMMSLFMDTMPLRIRDIYIINQPWYFSVFWGVAKLFFKRKIVKRVHMLGTNFDELFKCIDPADLPPDFGGTLDEPADYFVRLMEEKEKTGFVGGFAVPVSVDDPTGEKRGLTPLSAASVTTSAAATADSKATTTTATAAAGAADEPTAAGAGVTSHL